MPDTDEATERILDIFEKETDWKNQTLKLNQDRDFNECDAHIQNKLGVMRVRIRDILDAMVEDAEHDGMEHADENKEPAFDWSELD